MGRTWKWYYLLIAIGVLLVIAGGSTSFMVKNYNWDWRVNIFGQFLAAIGAIFLAIGWHQKSIFRRYLSKAFKMTFRLYKNLPEIDHKCVDFIGDWKQQIELACRDNNYIALGSIAANSVLAGASGPIRCRQLIIDMWKNVLALHKEDMFIVQYILIGIVQSIPVLKGHADIETAINNALSNLTLISRPTLTKNAKQRLNWALDGLKEIFGHVIAFEHEWTLRNRNLLLALTVMLPLSFPHFKGKVPIKIQNEIAKEISNVLNPFAKKLHSLN